MEILIAETNSSDSFSHDDIDSEVDLELSDNEHDFFDTYQVGVVRINFIF